MVLLRTADRTIVRPSASSPGAMFRRAVGPLAAFLFVLDIVHLLWVRPAVLEPMGWVATLSLTYLLLVVAVVALLGMERVAATLYGRLEAACSGRWLGTIAGPAVMTVTASPLLWLLARQPFIGNRYRDSAAAVIGPWILLVVLGLVTFAGVWLGARILKSWFSGTAGSIGQAGLAITCAALFLGTLLVDALWYVGWYPLIHSVLSLASAMLASIMVLRWVATGRSAPLFRSAIVGAVIAVPLLALTWQPVALWRVSTGTLFASRLLTPALHAGVDSITLEGLSALPSAGLGEFLHRPSVLTVPSALASEALFVTVDTLRADAVGWGRRNTSISPAIDEFFKDGLIYERAYSQYAATRHSIRAILQSSYQSKPRGPRQDLIARLRHYGFNVVAILPSDMKMFVNVERYNFAYVSFYEDESMIPQAVERGMAAVPAEKRFVWVHLYQPHDPYTPAADFAAGDGGSGYDGEVRWMDHDFARILALFPRPPELVVLAADHGEEFREHGGTLHGRTTYDETLRVPLAIKVSGGPSGRITQPVANVDLAPTILAALGIPVPDEYEGFDLLGRASRAAPDRVIYAEAVTNAVMALQGHLKWTYWPDQGLWEIYDLENDPRELKNLASDTQLLARGQRLIALYRLTGEVLAELRSVPEEEFAPWFTQFVSALDKQPPTARWAAYQLARRFSANEHVRQALATAASRENDASLLAFVRPETGRSPEVSTAGHKPAQSIGPVVETAFMVPIPEIPLAIDAALTSPLRGVRQAALEEVGAKDPARAVHLLQENTVAEAPALVAGLGRSGSPTVLPVLSSFLDHSDPDVRFAAASAICAVDGARELTSRMASESSPEVSKVLLVCLLKHDRERGIIALREETTGRRLSPFSRAELIADHDVSELGAHLADLFAESDSGSFREFLVEALARLKLPPARFAELVGKMRQASNDPQLLTRIDAHLRRSAS